MLLVPATYLVLWRTAFGLRLRSCGENPYAAESLGVNVYRYKYVAVIISGALAGLGGVFLAEVAADIYQEGQTGGRGYIGLAAMIFGNWRPGGLAVGAGLFGYTDSLQLRSGGRRSTRCCCWSRVLLAGRRVWQLRRKRVRRRRSSRSASRRLLAGLVPRDRRRAAPGHRRHARTSTTLLVLALAAQRLRMPKADGCPTGEGEG